VLNALSRKEGEHELVAREWEKAFRETGDGEMLFACCLARRMTKSWSFIADHAEELIRLLGTEAAMRLGVEGTLNDRRPELTLKLLQDHANLCPAGILPPDLERARAEAFKQQGQFGKAVEAGEKAASASPDLPTLVHLFRLKLSKGDLIGSAEIAKQFLKFPVVPPQFLTEEVAPAIRRVAPELTRELVLKAKNSLPENSPALLLVAQQASKLGLANITDEVFGKLHQWAQSGVNGIQL